VISYAEHKELERGLIVRGGRTLCWHRWATDLVNGAWRYRECARCGRREASRLYSNIAGPVDGGWLETGTWTPPPTAPPKPSPLPSPSRGIRP